MVWRQQRSLLPQLQSKKSREWGPGLETTMVKSDPAPGRALDTMVRSDPAPGIALDTPLRLEVAVKLAFPAGGMTVAGLRTEIRRGTLPVENIAGKLFVTLAGIDEMRET